MNITDVGHLVSDADTGEDKMEKGSRRTGKSAWEIADHYAKAFMADMDHLNIQQPHIWCKATDHIAEQIAFIQCIDEKGYAYRTSDGIYFDTARLPEYGYLARLDIEGLRAGTRIEMGEKRNPTDFALWKFSPPGQKRQMEWESPWGIGFPGWHIECSAMSAKYLGYFFDIHCGGEDHIPVHHPNEIAQTQACYGTRLANFWMHGYFLQLGEDRMSKSSGEFLRIQTLIDHNVDPLAYRFFCLGAHYRAKLNFAWEGLESAARSLERLRSLAYEWGLPGNINEDYIEQFTEQVNDDLNTPRALAVTWDMARSNLDDSTKKATLLYFDRVLGLRLGQWQPPQEVIPEEITRLVHQRQQARLDKRWGEADALRNQVLQAGFDIEDTPQGPRIKAHKVPFQN
jgi:cysteinyl-tRNA synthetase